MSTVDHSPLPWVFTYFTKPDGSEIKTVQDVADTTAASAFKGEGTTLWGVSEESLDEDGAVKIICYTGNGPHSEANARLIVAAINALNITQPASLSTAGTTDALAEIRAIVEPLQLDDMPPEVNEGALSSIYRILERAAAPAGSGEGAKWLKVPNEQAWWWHWNGEVLAIPHIFSVMVSKTGPDRYFVADGQNAPWCDEMGGWWLKVEYPNVPTREYQRASLTSSPGEQK
jgi:hypothetical protein